MASQQGHWYPYYDKAVTQIYNEHPAHSILSQLARVVAGKGENTWLSSIDAGNSDDASTKNFTLDATLKKFHQLDGGSQTFAEWLNTRTPFNDVSKLQTFSQAQLIDWGHSYSDAEDTWQNICDPKNDTLNVGMQKMHKQVDINFGKAVTATGVSRKIDGAGIATVNLPASQILPDLTYAEVNVDTLPAMINEVMGNAWFTTGMPIYCAISTTTARHLKKNSSNELRSTDFIASYAEFQNGTIPKVEGVTFIVLPKAFMEEIKAVEGVVAGDQTDHYFAWSPQAIAKVPYQALKTSIGPDAGGKFNDVAYVREFVDFVRTDDNGVVLGDIVVA